MSAYLGTEWTIDESRVQYILLRTNSNSSDVIHKQSDIQPFKPLRDPPKVHIRSVRVRQKVFDIPTGRRRGFQLVDHGKDLLLVPPMDDQVEPLIVQLLRQSFPDTIRRTRDQRVWARTGEVLLVCITWTKEIEPDGIEENSKVVETEEETNSSE